MPVAKVIEISSTSERSFEDAIQRGIARATRSLRGVTSAWVKEQNVMIEANAIKGYRVNLLITFVLSDEDEEGEEAGAG
jgi:flavin-binding protein dodecin